MEEKCTEIKLPSEAKKKRKQEKNNPHAYSFSE